MKSYKVGIIGATGMVGQRFVLLLENHPWFKITLLAASSRSAGKTYAEAVDRRWYMEKSIPDDIAGMRLFDAADDIKKITSETDFVFCAVDMKKEETKSLEETYAKSECPVISNNSANRFTPDVPMIIPELNPEHLEIIAAQKRRLGTKRGFIAVKSNCSIQSYVPALHPIRKFGIKNVLVCTYQAISGAGKTFDTWPQMKDNLIPYIGGEEEKSEKEPLKIWGGIDINKQEIKIAETPSVTTQCVRVPVSNGHLAAVFVKFQDSYKPSKEEVINCWRNFSGEPQKFNLPNAPEHFLTYFDEEDYPQVNLHRDLEKGMGISLGRLRADESGQYDYKFIGLSHNTLRGAAGGAVLLAELCAVKGLF